MTGINFAFMRIKESIEKDDEKGVIEATKAFFAQFHPLSRSTSLDVMDD